ncbi:hypothetical protein HOF78_00185 [Candidatus Woesearchaeota archaeon]|jgi:hypothetical protein|nr:hypothetical protein [Candidatus Woesearchaeota archaeon]MBT6044768.1 hypothetical protein [Candidatus Woesearchaeota archaeon]
MEISLEKLNENEFLVTIGEDESFTEHVVTVEEESYQKLTDKMCSKELLVEKSIEFLLTKEPKESILEKFEIMLIAKYFPEYPDEIKKII